jgi:hypothetical protein
LDNNLSIRCRDDFSDKHHKAADIGALKPSIPPS